LEVLYFTSQLGSGADEIINEIKSPIWTFYGTQSFFSQDMLGLGAWGTPGLGGPVGKVIMLKRTFSELVWGFVQNLLEIGESFCV